MDKRGREVDMFIDEYAKQQNAIESTIQNKTEVIVEHIFKLMLMPNHNSYNHWKREIANQFNEVRKLKGSNKLPKKEQIFEWSYEDISDQLTDVNFVQNRIDNIIYDYGENSVVYDYDLESFIANLNNICYNYFNWLSDELSKTGYVANSSIYRKLDKLI